MDTFEAVKNNIFDMLGDLAQDFNDEQLDLLFSKFEVNKGRPVPDSIKIMDLMRRLAKSDTKAPPPLPTPPVCSLALRQAVYINIGSKAGVGVKSSCKGCLLEVVLSFARIGLQLQQSFWNAPFISGAHALLPATPLHYGSGV